MIDHLLSFIAPHTCLQCGVEGSLWCDACRRTAPLAAERCYRCHRYSPAGRTCTACRRKSPLYSVRAATRYEGHAKRLVWRLKFVRARAGAYDAGELIVSRFALPDGAVMTPVPAVTGHVRRRGYDQSVLIARQIARRSGVPYAPLLLRHGQRQQRSAPRSQRLTQLADAFQPVRYERIQGAHVVLVDDVITTGATLEAAARALRAAGAKRVSAVIFAQA